jgi:hypothetical protein
MWPWYKMLPSATKQHNKPRYTKVTFCISTFKRFTMPDYNFTTIYERLYVTHRSDMFRHKLSSLGRLSLVYKGHCKTNAYLSSIKQYKTHLLKSNTAQTQVKTFFCFLFVFGATPPPPPVGHGLFIHEISRSHTTINHSR